MFFKVSNAVVVNFRKVLLEFNNNFRNFDKSVHCNNNNNKQSRFNSRFEVL